MVDSSSHLSLTVPQMLAVIAAGMDALSGGGDPANVATNSNVSGSASSVTVLAANAARKGATIFNDSAATLYLDLSGGTASTTNFTVKLRQDDYYEVPFRFTGAITGIWASATGAARITEIA